jgi:hypothetical protein
LAQSSGSLPKRIENETVTLVLARKCALGKEGLRYSLTYRDLEEIMAERGLGTARTRRSRP